MTDDEQGRLTFRFRPDDKVSEACIQLEELIASAVRNSRNALGVMGRIHNSSNSQDRDLLTALKKYVEDTCEAIKVADNKFRDNDTGLEYLVFEVPGTTQDDEASWRNLIGRRDVIAHRILTIDDNRVYREAVRDFGSLHELLSKIYFVPTKTDLASSRGPVTLVRGEVLRSLAPSEANTVPSIGQCFIIIFEDEREGFLSFRLGRSVDNELLWTTTRVGNITFSGHLLA